MMGQKKNRNARNVLVTHNYINMSCARFCRRIVFNVELLNFDSSALLGHNYTHATSNAGDFFRALLIIALCHTKFQSNLIPYNTYTML